MLPCVRIITITHRAALQRAVDGLQQLAFLARPKGVALGALDHATVQNADRTSRAAGAGALLLGFLVVGDETSVPQRETGAAAGLTTAETEPRKTEGGRIYGCLSVRKYTAHCTFTVCAM